MTSLRHVGFVRPGYLLALSASLFGLSFATVSATPGAAAAPTRAATRQDARRLPPPANDEEGAKIGEETTVKICAECHDFEQVVALRRTPREWRDMVAAMADRGANATTEEFATVRQYLTRVYGIVGVNTAPAADLTTVLGLSPEAADAVVAYRTAHGKFADVAALAKVPGLDKSLLEAQAEKLRFD